MKHKRVVLGIGLALVMLINCLFFALPAFAADETPQVLTDGGTLSGNYILNGDVQLTTNITVAKNTSLTINLNGHLLKGTGVAKTSVITAGAGSTVTINDTSASQTGGITGGNATNGGAIYSAGKVIINGGNIYGNKATSNGGAIYTKDIEIHGGVIGDLGFTIRWEGLADTKYPNVYDTAYMLDVVHTAKKNSASKGGD